MNAFTKFMALFITLTAVACGGPDRIVRRGVDYTTGATNNNRDRQVEDGSEQQQASDASDDTQIEELSGLDLFAACAQLSIDEVEPQADMDMEQIQPMCDEVGNAAFVTNLELGSVDFLEFI